MGKIIRYLRTMDGNTAAAYIAYAFSEVAAIYPITPSSVMAENIDKMAVEGNKNIFGSKVEVIEMQSEAGAAGALHGVLATGTLASTFTSSQGLLLMIPNMYKIAGEKLPAVFHVAARAISTHALSIFGDHSDVMATRATGFSLFASSSPQEVMDIGALSHLVAIRAGMPILHFFDGFRTSHEQQKILTWDYQTLKNLISEEDLRAFRNNANNPNHPFLMGSAEQPETFFQHTEARNISYLNLIDIIKDTFKEINELVDTNYDFFNYYGSPDATRIIVAMGSVCETIMETIDYLNGRGERVGLIQVHVYRPWSAGDFIKVLPKTVKKIAVLDRTKEPGSLGEPLYLDVSTAILNSQFKDIFISGGRFGLGSKDTPPGDIIAIFDNLKSDNPKKEFTISIEDDVTNLSLKRSNEILPQNAGTKSCKFWGLGSDGTISANKNTIKIIGDNTSKYVQAYFQYDSKKSGGTTISHLRFSDEPIHSAHYVSSADFVACHRPEYLKKYDIVQDIKENGTFLLNTSMNADEILEYIPYDALQYLITNNINFYICNAFKIAKEIGLGETRINTIMQSAFFKLTDIIPLDDAIKYMKEAAVSTYGSKGDKVISMNIEAIESGITNIEKINLPGSTKDFKSDIDNKSELPIENRELNQYINDILIPFSNMKGDKIPVSAFLETANGKIPPGTSKFEKRGIANAIPKWKKENCIGCNICSYVCPHSAIRSFATCDSSLDKHSIKLKNNDKYNYIISISPHDCVGCGACEENCVSKNKALKMIPFQECDIEKMQNQFDYLLNNSKNEEIKGDTIKDLAFAKPLLEFSGACPGCGETPYAKILTQLFGDRMFIANATGCSSIWGGSAPSNPYTTNSRNKGPAWANSLFEDNAEFGLGIAIAIETRRNNLIKNVKELLKDDKLKDIASKWLDMKDFPESNEIGEELVNHCNNSNNKNAKIIAENSDILGKPSIWIIGGDGWAYDIGFGGLDHVLASSKDVNILVFDTEVYSNTGGQASKSTPPGASAKFAYSGKEGSKKNLAEIAMTYESVYVAKIAMGANINQTIKAFKEAESYNGVSIIIAYSPCIAHGIKGGMKNGMKEMKNAVESGYWPLFRFDPRRLRQGKNPLIIDSKVPSQNYKEFLMNEMRFKMLYNKDKERAEYLFGKSEKDSQIRYKSLEAKRNMYEDR